MGTDATWFIKQPGTETVRCDECDATVEAYDYYVLRDRRQAGRATAFRPNPEPELVAIHMDCAAYFQMNLKTCPNCFLLTCCCW
jgi:hypothetical protein